MISVVSSNLDEVGYDGQDLYIRFHGGRLYRYFNVPESVYIELLNAPSKGQYHARHIKYVYRYERL